MTREEMRQAKAEKLRLKILARLEKKISAQELRAWNKMVLRVKAKGAWIEESTN